MRAPDVWHSDVTWRPEPSMGSILRIVESPPFGGDTLWADMGAAYDLLDERTPRNRSRRSSALHDYVRVFGRHLPRTSRRSCARSTRPPSIRSCGRIPKPAARRSTSTARSRAASRVWTSRRATAAGRARAHRHDPGRAVPLPLESGQRRVLGQPGHAALRQQRLPAPPACDGTGDGRRRPTVLSAARVVAAMTEHAVVIAGGGPTGLMLAAELALAGIDVVIVERRANQDLDGSRAGGLHARTIEVLDQRGIAERFLAAGAGGADPELRRTPLDISDFPTRHNYGLALWQSHTERILAGWVGELGVPLVREREVTGFAQDDDRRRRRAVRRTVPAGGLPRRVRRRAQRGPQGGRHRVPRVWTRRPAGSSPRSRWTSSRSSALRRGRWHRPVDRGTAASRSASCCRNAQSSTRERADAAGPPRRARRRRTGPTSACTARRGSPASPT